MYRTCVGCKIAVLELRCTTCTSDEFSKTGEFIARDEMKRLLKSICPASKPNDADVEFVLSKVDLNEDNRVNRTEVLPTLALWLHVTKRRKKAKVKAGCCGTPPADGQEDDDDGGGGE